MTSELTVIGRGIIGVAVLILIGLIISRDRKHISWKWVLYGMAFIIALAIIILKIPFMRSGVELVATLLIKLVDFSDAGAAFLFGNLASNMNRFGYIFVFHVFPSIIFFSAISSILYYFGILPKIIQIFAWLLRRWFHVSGAECTAAAANVFFNQITAPIMIKPYLPRMSKAEIFCVMTGGMATISGGIMLGIISILGSENPELRLQFATFLLVSSILSAPAALLFSYIILPKQVSIDDHVRINTEDIGLNLFDAILKGTEDGMHLSLRIGGILIIFIGLLYAINWVLFDGIGNFFGINSWIADVSGSVYKGLTLEAILGVVFSPIAWLLGIDSQDILLAGQLLGEKLVFNEFVAYVTFSEKIANAAFMNPHSITLITFALCNFANLTSIGVQISSFSALASNQRHNVAHLALLAVIAGNLACFLSACIAGVLLP